jgi:hypothetical protein
MIEILGVKIGLEAGLFIIAFAASEVIGESKLKENSILGLVKSLIDSLRDSRTEDEKVVEVKEAAVEFVESLKDLGE